MTSHGWGKTVASRRVGREKGRIDGWKFRLRSAHLSSAKLSTPSIQSSNKARPPRREFVEDIPAFNYSVHWLHGLKLRRAVFADGKPE